MSHALITTGVKQAMETGTPTAAFVLIRLGGRRTFILRVSGIACVRFGGVDGDQKV